MITNSQIDPSLAAAAKPDAEGTLRPHSTEPSEPARRDIAVVTATDHHASVQSNLDLPISWDDIQGLNINTFPPTAADQGNDLGGGVNENTVTIQDMGNPSSMQTVDLVGVSCSCLNELYSILASFQSLPPTSFPASRGPLIKATNLARRVVRCPHCPQDYPSALQNLMLLTTLLPLVAHGYAKLLQHIQEQAAQGCAVTYRVGDSSLSTIHLHTGTPECPMGFNVELDAEEWASMARKVVKQDIYGNNQKLDCVLSVVEELEQRQWIWHLLQPSCTDTLLPPCHSQQNEPDQQGLCMQLIGVARRAIDNLKL